MGIQLLKIGEIPYQLSICLQAYNYTTQYWPTSYARPCFGGALAQLNTRLYCSILNYIHAHVLSFFLSGYKYCHTAVSFFCVYDLWDTAHFSGPCCAVLPGSVLIIEAMSTWLSELNGTF